MTYYFLINGETRGPCSFEELEKLEQQKEITRETMVSSPGSKDWRPLYMVLEFDRKLNQSPPAVNKIHGVKSPPFEPPPEFMTHGQGQLITFLLIGMFTFAVLKTSFTAVLPSPKWEYKIESIDDYAFQTQMDAMGARGWEMVFARRAAESDRSSTFKYEVIFKRPR